MPQSYWDHPLREILMTVQGYSKWGFDVYRTSFEDDDKDDELSCRMWQYVWADTISELYGMLCDCGEWWITAFAWPPEVYGSMA
ncbi:hypothetical protein PG996_010734 [Apiospora saccharicola]|uniref:Uncharacterized protein n=1 Tax=Apiospora saccharicola TaxID=335842 RepID=A0ABR1UPF3_9PEZI